MELAQKIDINYGDQQKVALLKKNIEREEQIMLKLSKEDQIFWSEFFRMFVFVYGSTCSLLNTGIDLHIFFCILISISIFTKPFKGHLNPGISIVNYWSRDNNMTFRMFWAYIKAQICGAIFSVFVALILNDVYRYPVAPIQSNLRLYHMRLMASQAIGTFILMFFVMILSSKYSFVDNKAAKFLFITIFVYLGRKYATFSTSQINMALVFSRSIIGIVYCNFQGLKFLYIWIIGNLLGITIAICTFSFLVQPTIEYVKQKNKRFEDEESDRSSDSFIQMNELRVN